MIDWNNRTITGKSGKVYKIEPENIKAGRWSEYEIQSLMLAFSANFKDHYHELNEMLKDIDSLGLNKITVNDINKIRNRVVKMQGSVTDFANQPIPKYIKFCSIFCNSEDENTAEYSETLIREKYEDWKHIPYSDFFLLCSEVIPLFKSVYRLEKEKKTGNGQYQT